MEKPMRRAELLSVLDAIHAGGTADVAETQTLDFKTQKPRSVQDTLEDLADAVACFANAGGGTVVVGVADRVAGPDAFVGHTLDSDGTRKRIYELTDPSILVEVEAVTHQGGDVLAVHVPRGVTVHKVKSKMPTERVGTSCMPMSTHRIASLVAERQGDDWSAHDSGVEVNAVDDVAVAVARSRLERSVDPRRRERARGATVEMLRGLGVVTERNTLTNAGALLFRGLDQFPVLVAYVFRRTPTGALAANEQLSGPLVTVLQRVFDLVEVRIDRTSVSVGSGQQLQVGDLPDAAVREAVVNAVMHRDYRRTDRVTVEHSPTRLAVTSPGGFVTGVRADNVLTTSSRTRNGSLAQAIRGLDFAETAGTGVDRMYAEMARIGHQPPVYQADPESVTVTLRGGAPNASLTRFVSTLPADEAEDADMLMVLLTLLTQRLVDAREMTPRLQKPDVAETQAVLDRLASDEVRLIEPTRETRRNTFPRYRLREEPVAALGSAVAYRRRTADQLDRKVIALVKEAGMINSRMVRLMLDLDVQTTSRLLRDLVDRGFLVRTSKATRGTSVTYGPGPKAVAGQDASVRPADRPQSEELDLD
ncbi:ATP-binding protein [Isoptericola sediminis]|uniref:Transcriptional regulator n=1 Tax=Isoptericola sediminis TaxID=2733572 RepID=A0A849K7T4_9MICO|nr:ATP-binding protein [Isoptericola sediminis]NNU27257.1 transcriptional regulator [Isoptericola sediminis]